MRSSCTRLQSTICFCFFREIVPEPNGTKSIIVDVKSMGYIYNPVNDEVILIILTAK